MSGFWPDVFSIIFSNVVVDINLFVFFRCVMKLAKAGIIKELDRRAMEEYGISGAVLMENAGSGIARMLLDKYPKAKDKGVVIVCGRGNNGGDGFVIARHLYNFGIEVDVFIAGKVAKVKDGESRVNLDIVKKMGIGVAEIERDEDLLALTRSLRERGVIVDAFLGTGIEREVEGMYARIIMAVNDISAGKDKKVLSVDIPSGIDSDSGNILGVAIRADATVALALPKLGEVVYPGADYAGEVYLLDISIPKTLVERMEINSSILLPTDFFSLMVKRASQAHKGDFGHLLIIAGSPGKTGAAALAADGALLTGSGLVTVGVPASLNDIMEIKTTAAMTLPLPDDGGGNLLSSAISIIEASIKNIVDNKNAIGAFDAIAIGPGLGTSKGVREVMRGLIEKSEIPKLFMQPSTSSLARIRASPSPTSTATYSKSG